MTQPTEHWFELLFDSVSHFLAVLDLEGKITRANLAALLFMDLSQTEIEGQPLWQIPWPALKKPGRKALQKAAALAAGGAPAKCELEIRRPRQADRTVEFSIQPVRDPAGTVKFLLAEGRDVTAFEHARQALAQSEARFRAIFEEAGVGIVIKGVNGRMLDCNPAFQAMLGYPAEELLRLDYLDITHPAHKKVSQKLFNELVAGKRKNYLLEKRYIRKDGQEVWGRMTASLVGDLDGTPQFVVGVVENITLTRQIEAELKELQQRLMQGREMERLRLAQDLHDGPLQEIIAVSYQVQELVSMISDEDGQQQGRAIRGTLQELARSVRAICGDLRPSWFRSAWKKPCGLTSSASRRLTLSCRSGLAWLTMPNPCPTACAWCCSEFTRKP